MSGSRERLLAVARGDERADLVLKRANVLDVFTGRVERADIAFCDGLIAGLGEYRGRREEDASRGIAAPAFIEAHIHVESSMLAPREFARAVSPHGTGTAVCDPHEIANVLGTAGIRWMLEAAEGLPVDLLFMFPSCVPAGDFETSGARLEAEDARPFLSEKRVLGLAEVMNFPGAALGFRPLMDKMELFEGRPIDGHAPGLSGPMLNAYLCAGPSTDHECTTLEEAREKLSRGMAVFMREGTAARNLADLIGALDEFTAPMIAFCSDDRHPAELLSEGHVDSIVRKAAALGLDPVKAVRAATLHPARIYGLHDRGAIAPGRRADVIFLDDLESLRVMRVFHRGVEAARDGELTVSLPPSPPLPSYSVRVDWSRFDPAPAVEGDRVKVIGVSDGQIVTRKEFADTPSRGGRLASDPGRDLAKVCVIERHRATGNFAVGLVRGFGLKRGALASTVAHDSHNIIAVGTDDADLELAARAVAEAGGGQAVVERGRVLELLALPIAGLMTDSPVEEAATGTERLQRAAAALGCTLSAPFMTMSFLALTPIPELKISDLGLFDSTAFKPTPLFGED